MSGTLKTSLLNYPFELVAPMAAIGSVLLLPLGPLLIPRTYIWFLLIYFTLFLYTQVSHVFKFYLTATKMKQNIRAWNQRSTMEEEKTKPRLNDQDLNDMETSLQLYEENHFIHAFIVPNYAEPEALLRDTIKRLANHK